jgi:hypothetical protein
MFNRKITFILGAGTSAPYMFPSGPELVEKICLNLNGDHTPEFELLVKMGEDPHLIKRFVGCLHNSSINSIDSLLEHRKEFLEIGKAAIAQALLPIESPQTLFAKRYELNGEREIQLYTARWYEYLVNIFNPSFEEFLNNISFITFNYDRSLEFFLMTALQNRYGKTEKECSEKLNSIPIIHIHGKLGELPWQSSEFVQYGGEGTTPSSISIARKNIRIIHEEIEADNQLKKAHALMNQANRIFFLGFGYHRLNVSRLQPGFASSSYGKVHGTAFRLEEREKHFISTLFRGAARISLADSHTDTLKFLRNSTELQ